MSIKFADLKQHHNNLSCHSFESQKSEANVPALPGNTQVVLLQDAIISVVMVYI